MLRHLQGLSRKGSSISRQKFSLDVLQKFVARVQNRRVSGIEEAETEVGSASLRSLPVSWVLETASYRV